MSTSTTVFESIVRHGKTSLSIELEDQSILAVATLVHIQVGKMQLWLGRANAAVEFPSQSLYPNVLAMNFEDGPSVKAFAIGDSVARTELGCDYFFDFVILSLPKELDGLEWNPVTQNGSLSRVDVPCTVKTSVATAEGFANLFSYLDPSTQANPLHLEFARISVPEDFSIDFAAQITFGTYSRQFAVLHGPLGPVKERVVYDCIGIGTPS